MMVTEIQWQKGKIKADIVGLSLTFGTEVKFIVSGSITMVMKVDGSVDMVTIATKDIKKYIKVNKK